MFTHGKGTKKPLSSRTVGKTKNGQITHSALNKTYSFPLVMYKPPVNKIQTLNRKYRKQGVKKRSPNNQRIHRVVPDRCNPPVNYDTNLFDWIDPTPVTECGH